MVSSYRLETLLELRRRAEDEAKNEFAEAQKELAAERSLLQRLQDDLKRREQERRRKMAEYYNELLTKGKDALAMQGIGVYEKRLIAEEVELQERIQRQQQRVAEAEAKAECKRKALAEAAKAVKSIEKHKEKFLKRKKAEREAREDLAGEEIGNALFLARQRKE
jgi:flagellar export protein FliJ